jgi:putative tryptophan/tyrosine transport system substrate-binding protein
MKRREFIVLLSGAAAAWPLSAWAQETSNKIPLIGVLWHAASAEEEGVYMRVLVQAFQDHGYIEGRTIRLDHRFPAEDPKRFQILAQELVDEKPDVIIAVTNFGAVELKRATSTIPIVVALAYDPIGTGLVKSFARPDGNVTGLSLMLVDLSGKRLELLKDAVPNLSRVALLVDFSTPNKEGTIKSHKAAAQALGMSLSPVEILTTDDIDPAFAKMAQDGTNGVVRAPGSALFNWRALVGAAALKYRLPVMSYNADEVPHGILMTYGQDVPEFFRQSVVYTTKILNGAKPADLPVEQPTRFKLVLNLKAAKVLGLTFPQSLLATADDVIE